MPTTAIVFLRNDLRTEDNPALYHAYQNFTTVIPIYIYDEGLGGDWSIGGASKWWLHHSLASLSTKLPIVFLKGIYKDTALKIVEKIKPDAVFWNRCYEPHMIQLDTELKAEFKNKDIEVQSFNAALLFEPWEIKNNSGQFFKVFTPFWRKCLETGVNRLPLSVPSIAKHDFTKLSEPLSAFNLLPTNPDWAEGFRAIWHVGENGAEERLQKFLEISLGNYKEGRNLPGETFTSMLSPHLRFGEISPLQIWYQVTKMPHQDHNSQHFLSEIGWREFSYNLLFNFSSLPNSNFRPEFNAFDWKYNEKELNAWQKGLTGYPIVDAGMRELWHTGYMHNRVRMIVGSFLTKDLLIDWREGAKWFWDTLVDADLANNSASWQWVAGSGADASPYYRIFNPVLQGEKFDPDGKYVRKWVPELSKLPNNLIHKPWLASPLILRASNVMLGDNYPQRLVDHDFARKLALEHFNRLKAFGNQSNP